MQSNPATPQVFVHTPYTNAYDMVPYGSEDYLGSCDSQPLDGSVCVSTPGPATPHGFQNFTPPDFNSAQAPPFHTYLVGQCEFLEMSQSAVMNQPAPTTRTHKLFFGHIKFELTPAGLRYIIYMLTGVAAGKIEARGLGCYMAFFQSAEEMAAAKNLHKRALFDHSGVWFARNANQEEVLNHYADKYLSQMNGTHLPRGLLVVDEETARRRRRRNAKSPAPTPSALSSLHLTADQLWYSQPSTPMCSFAESESADVMET